MQPIIILNLSKEAVIRMSYQLKFILATHCNHNLKWYNQNIKGIDWINRLFEFIYQNINL